LEDEVVPFLDEVEPPRHRPTEDRPLTTSPIGKCNIIKRTFPVCTMFGNTELKGGASLKVCNKVYGSEYEGDP
jgi:hypothetical protein